MLAVVGSQTVGVVYLEAVIRQGHPCNLDRVCSCFLAVVSVADDLEGFLACHNIFHKLSNHSRGGGSGEYLSIACDY